ncbi:hypothetical protein KP509_21G067900 [Ceratopteris richardii]|uniref:Uncharacterized protein n=1 Tax=Ceratopteris richardii TaxID=49495 RepID=A0A8T2SAX7_CERRI|nr:hypothetical protein KP509_21G067900 [Ceratopteris richardii]
MQSRGCIFTHRLMRPLKRQQKSHRNPRSTSHCKKHKHRYMRGRYVRCALFRRSTIFNTSVRIAFCETRSSMRIVRLSRARFSFLILDYLLSSIPSCGRRILSRMTG